MWFKKKKTAKEKTYPIKDISLEEVRHAIHAFSKELPADIPLKIVAKDDLSLDYSLLAPFLKGIPEKNYYMSKETYDLFEEEEKHIPLALDQIQHAVDQYIAQTNELPVIDHDPYRKVNFFKLEKLKLIEERPEMDFYITDQEQLVTTVKPE
ncbi:DUF3939 domain-containing protein [Gracilibacillus salinarum]|uniref:DUF3939 domain-containing protein n=1 Tax=Gracilibacillus salinarum TaxID=2932255 RepID=A0ABY4GQD1_9BACI|nr:DUF3939 domain-containing protein [Gracilibacillus salinarum]UOQ86562.1 DUF3939 domain-containing protein [Gracilibacillus salinarum]